MVIAKHVRILENQFHTRDWFDSDTCADSTEQSGGDKTNMIYSEDDKNSTASEEKESLSTGETLSAQQIEALTHYPPKSAPQAPVDNIDIVSNMQIERTTRYPLRNRKETLHYELSTALAAAISQEPTTVEEAKSCGESQKWMEAIQQELKSPHDHKTWTVERLPEGNKTLSTDLRKLRIDGSVSRFKPRLVVRGFLECRVENSYAPVVDFSTIRVMSTIAVHRKYYVHQMDVRTSFLHGELYENFYIRPATGLDLTLQRSEALRLQKALYGMRKARCLWFEKWSEVMKCQHFESLRSAQCVYRRKDLQVLLYIDRIIITGPLVDDIIKLKKKLEVLLYMKDLGELGRSFGIHFDQDSEGACLSQNSPTKDIIRRFDMQNCKRVRRPVYSRGR